MQRLMHEAFALMTLVGLVAGVRIQRHASNEASNASASTRIDIWVCDKMCMQCPDGRNILIQRQKSGKANVIGGVTGAFSFGWGMTAVTQLAGCSKIGFEFWQDRGLMEEQPLTTDAFMGLLWVHSGLEKLKETTSDKNTKDLQALEACNRLTDTYTWSALKGLGSFESSYTRQQRFARQCLAHSKLCGQKGLEEELELQTARFNPFSHESMCEAPPEKDEHEVTQQEIDEFGAKMKIPGPQLESLGGMSNEVKRLVMLKWPEEGKGVSEFAEFMVEAQDVVAKLPAFIFKWSLDDESVNELSRLPIKVQISVLSDFSGGGVIDDSYREVPVVLRDEVKAAFLSFLKSQLAARVAAEAPKMFILSLNLDDDCLQALTSQTPIVQRAVMAKYQPPADGDYKQAFLDYITSVATIEQQIAAFILKWHLNEDCSEELSMQPLQLQKQIIENFEPESSVDIVSTFKAFVKSAAAAAEEDKASNNMQELAVQTQDSIEAGRNFIKQAPRDAEPIVKEAGLELEQFVKEENPNGDFTLGDDEIGLKLHEFCLNKCKDAEVPASCKDGCCWKTCVSYKNTPGPKCSRKCSHGARGHSGYA